MFYLVKAPSILKKYYSSCVWNMPRDEKKIYLTFDDGPHPEATPFVLDELKKYQAKATFFCIGKNVARETILYKRILEEGHRVGNHTYNHVNGWKVANDVYFEDIGQARALIDSDLFRPPYGRVSRFQVAGLQAAAAHFKVIMWDVLSGDFDEGISAEKCTSNVIGNVKNGSIVVFHDSAKAMKRMQRTLQETLKHFTELGYRFESIR